MGRKFYDISNIAIPERPKFYDDSKPHATKLITPLGAAIVEAMPDRKAIRYIRKRFRELGQVPISSLFKAEDISAFYEDYAIKPVPRGPRPAKQRCPCLTKETPCPDCWHYGHGTVCSLCENTGAWISQQPEKESEHEYRS